MKAPISLTKEQKQQLFLKTMNKLLQKNQSTSPAKTEEEPAQRFKDRIVRREKPKPKRTMVQMESRAVKNRKGRKGARSLLGA